MDKARIILGIFLSILVLTSLVSVITVSYADHGDFRGDFSKMAKATSVSVEEFVLIPKEPKRLEPVFVFVKIRGVIDSIPKLKVNGTIMVIGPAGNVRLSRQFGPRYLPMVPVSDGWYVSAIPGLPARSGYNTIISRVNYCVIMEGSVHGCGGYEVVPEWPSLNASPVVFISVYEVINNTRLFRETLGLGPSGWRADAGEQVKVLIVALDDKKLENVCFEYSVSGNAWMSAPTYRDRLMDEYIGLIEELNSIFSDINNLGIGESLPEPSLPIEIRYANVPGQALGNYVMFRANAGDPDGKATKSPMGFYYVVDCSSATRVLIIDPSVLMYLLMRNSEALIERLKVFVENNINETELYGQTRNLTHIAQVLKGFAYVKFHHWELLGKYFNLYIMFPSNRVEYCLRSLQEGGFEPHVIILSNLWLGLNATAGIANISLSWDLKDIKVGNGTLLESLIDYIREHHAGLIATHGTLSDWVIWAECESSQHYKIGSRGHIGNSLNDVNPINETTLSSMLGLPLLPIWEFVRDYVALSLCKMEDPELKALGLALGSMPLQIPYVPFNDSLRVTPTGKGHPILEGVPEEFYIEIPDMPEELVERGYKAYTQVGWQLSMPSAIAYVVWWKINESRPTIKEVMRNVTFLIHNFTEGMFSPPKALDDLLDDSMRWGLFSLYRSIISMNVTDRTLTIEVRIPGREPIRFSLQFDYRRVLQYIPLKLIALSERGLAGILVYDKYWDRYGYRSVYFSMEIEASNSSLAEKLLKNAVSWTTKWEFMGITKLLGGLLRVPNEMADEFEQAVRRTSGVTTFSEGTILVEEGYTKVSLSVEKNSYLYLLVISPSSGKVNATIIGGVDAEIVCMANVSSGIVNITIKAYAEGSVELGLYADPESSINPAYVVAKTTDTRPPTISIVTPSMGEFVSGVISICANASDNIGVNRVEFYINGALLGIDREEPWEYDVNTTMYADGTYNVTVVVYDHANNSASQSVSIVIDNTPPTIKEISIEPSEPYEGVDVTVKVLAEDKTSGISHVILYYRVGEGSWNSVEMTYEDGAWMATIPKQKAGTNVTYYVEVYDNAGNSVKSGYYRYSVKSAPTTPTLLEYLSKYPMAIIGTAMAVIIALALITMLYKKRRP